MRSAFRLPGQLTPTRSRAGYQPREAPGAALQRFRTYSGIPLQEVADRMKVTVQALALLEAGENVHWHTLATCAHVVGRSIVVDLNPRVAFYNRTPAQISAVCGLSEPTTRAIMLWLSAEYRDDTSGLYLASVMKLVEALGGSITVF